MTDQTRGGNEAKGVVSKSSSDKLAMAVEREYDLLEGLAARLERQSGVETTGIVSQAMAFLMREEAKALRLMLSRLASQEETIRADGECLAKVADVWSLAADDAPANRRWHCQHEQWLQAASSEAHSRLAARQEGQAHD